MNVTSMTGFALAAAIIWFGVIGPAPKPELFLDDHALLMVVGGTLAAALIAFPLRRLRDLLSLFIFGFLFKRHASNRGLALEIISAAAAAKHNVDTLFRRGAGHPFLDEGYRLVAEGIIPADRLREILVLRSEYFRRSYGADAKLLNALSKFPPAFGLLGTSTGMISMMVNLKSGGQDSIGPAMASALVATFWGIALANFVLNPLADYAWKAAEDESQSRKLIVDGLMMLKEGCSTLEIAEHLNGYLPIAQRIAMAPDTPATARKAA